MKSPHESQWGIDDFEGCAYRLLLSLKKLPFDHAISTDDYTTAEVILQLERWGNCCTPLQLRSALP
jgi:hypothetical protein